MRHNKLSSNVKPCVMLIVLLTASCEWASSPRSGTSTPGDAVGVPSRAGPQRSPTEPTMRRWVQDIHDLAQQRDSSKMSSDSGCQTNCERATAICDLSHKICERSDEEPDNQEHAGYCRESKDLCSDAWSDCQRCAGGDRSKSLGSISSSES